MEFNEISALEGSSRSGSTVVFGSLSAEVFCCELFSAVNCFLLWTVFCCELLLFSVVNWFPLWIGFWLWFLKLNSDLSIRFRKGSFGWSKCIWSVMLLHNYSFCLDSAAETWKGQSYLECWRKGNYNRGMLMENVFKGSLRVLLYASRCLNTFLSVDEFMIQKLYITIYDYYWVLTVILDV